MINKNIIISLVALAIIVGGIFFIIKDRAAPVNETNTIIANQSGLTEFQTDTSLSKNKTDFTNDGTALRSFNRASYKLAP